MTTLVFSAELKGDETLDTSSSGILFSATGEHTVELPDSGVFSFVAANSGEVFRQITLTVAEGGTIRGGDTVGTSLVVSDYGVVTLIGESNSWKILSGYGSIAMT